MDPRRGDSMGGKPPKSGEQIRSAVELIHRNTAPCPPSGPLSNGLGTDERIVLATFNNAVLCRDFQRRLLAAGIMSSVQGKRRQTLLSVDVDDRTRAAGMLQQFLHSHPDRPIAGDRRPFDMTIFGALMGGTLGFIVQGGEVPSWTRAIALMGAFVLFGGLIGSFYDVARNRHRRTGQLQFALGELMMVIAMLAVAFLLRRLL